MTESASAALEDGKSENLAASIRASAVRPPSAGQCPAYCRVPICTVSGSAAVSCAMYLAG